MLSVTEYETTRDSGRRKGWVKGSAQGLEAVAAAGAAERAGEFVERLGVEGGFALRPGRWERLH
jgi:hypothetical protein